MIVFPAIAALVALACAGFVGWDALHRPRPERIIWAVAFLVFAVAAGSEVAGSMFGWTPALARLYYLTGAVLVVGFLALGELYLLAPGRVPAVVPGLTLLVIAVAATAVWSAPIDAAELRDEGWDAIVRGPFLVGLTASINAGGTLVLAGGAAYSAWSLRATTGAQRRAAGCMMIALGAIVVAMGGTLTRFGNREYLYLAMALGVSIIFAGVLLTRRPVRVAHEAKRAPAKRPADDGGPRRGSLVTLPARRDATVMDAAPTEGIRFLISRVLPLDDANIAATCSRWSARPVSGANLTRVQAQGVWSLRLELPDEARFRFDQLPLATQAQLAELYDEIWSAPTPMASDARRA